jgi:predicted Zn finger-like uncharacterized protein
MQIVCPACTAAYEVPLTLLKPGKAVRCARCANEWVPSSATVEAPANAPAAAPAGVAEKTAEDEIFLPMDPPPGARRNTALRLAWAGSIVALVVLGWAAYAARTPIMQAWPPSIRLYATLGVPIDR